MSDLATIKTIQPSKNAVKHGVYSGDVVLPWEDKAEFEALHQALREEYNPEGASEELAIFDLAGLYWKKRRLNIGSQLGFHRQANASKMVDPDKEGWERVASFLAKFDDGGMADGIRAMTKSHANAVQHYTDMIFKIVTRAPGSNEPGAEPKENIEFEKLALLGKELNVIGQELVFPTIQIMENHGRDVAERAYRPDIMEKELKLHDLIDRQIEKTLKRFVMMKECKNLYCRKSIDAKQSA